MVVFKFKVRCNECMAEEWRECDENDRLSVIDDARCSECFAAVRAVELKWTRKKETNGVNLAPYSVSYH